MIYLVFRLQNLQILYHFTRHTCIKHKNGHISAHTQNCEIIVGINFLSEGIRNNVVHISF